MRGCRNEKGRFLDGMCAKSWVFVNKFFFFEGVPFECEGKWNRERNNIFEEL